MDFKKRIGGFLNSNENNTNYNTSWTTINTNNSRITGDSNSINGNNNIISGDNNQIYGNNNVISGDNNDIRGNNNAVTGDSNSLDGNNNTENGEWNFGNQRRESRASRNNSFMGLQSNLNTDQNTNSINNTGIFGQIMNNNNYDTVNYLDRFISTHDNSTTRDIWRIFAQGMQNRNSNTENLVNNISNIASSINTISNNISNNTQNNASNNISNAQNNRNSNNVQQQKQQEQKQQEQKNNDKNENLILDLKCEETQEELLQCKICFVNKKNCCFNCGHSLCSDCSNQIIKTKKPCSFCNAKITNVTKLFL